MNARTSKLINRFAVKNQFNPRVIKRVWNAMPAPKRAEQRREMNRLLAT